ncbi:MAG: DUF1127 domain-containing protein [Thiolinea sp.]
MDSLRQAYEWRRQLRNKVQAERRQLAELPEHLLNDIGISRGEALTESQRADHDLPAARVRRVLRGC